MLSPKGTSLLAFFTYTNISAMTEMRSFKEMSVIESIRNGTKSDHAVDIQTLKILEGANDPLLKSLDWNSRVATKNSLLRPIFQFFNECAGKDYRIWNNWFF
jgi:hypothetical protein